MSSVFDLITKDEKVEQAQQAQKVENRPKTSVFNLLHEVTPESQQAKSNINATQDVDPETAAKNYEMSKQSGIPLAIVNEAPEEVFKRIEHKDAVGRTPEIDAYISRSHLNSSISGDDGDGLENVQKTFTEKVQHSFKRGQRNVELGNLRAAQLFGDVSEDTERRIQAIKAEQAGGISPELQGLIVPRRKLSEVQAEREAFEPEGLIEEGLLGAAEQAPILLETLTRGLERGFLGAAIGTGTAVVAGQLGPQVLAPEEVVTVPAFALGGFGIGVKAGSAEAIFKLEAGLASVF
jgi:hypothetical protein